MKLRPEVTCVTSPHDALYSTFSSCTRPSSQAQPLPLCCRFSFVLPLSLLLSLLCLLSRRALRWAPCSPPCWGDSRWADPAGLSPSACGRGHGPPPSPLSLPPPSPEDLADVWSGVPWIPPRSASVLSAHCLQPWFSRLEQVGRCQCPLSCILEFIAFFFCCPFLHVCAFILFLLFLIMTSATVLNFLSNWMFLFLFYCMSFRLQQCLWQ